MKLMTKIGIFFHGFKSIGDKENDSIEKILWGEPPHNLGVIPKLVNIILARGINNFSKILIANYLIGSDRSFLSEIRYYMSRKYFKINEFYLIQSHGKFNQEIDQIRRLIERAIVEDYTSINYEQEFMAAIKVFSEIIGITEVIEVVPKISASNCLSMKINILDQIPVNQIWSTIIV